MEIDSLFQGLSTFMNRVKMDLYRFKFLYSCQKCQYRGKEWVVLGLKTMAAGEMILTKTEQITQVNKMHRLWNSINSLYLVERSLKTMKTLEKMEYFSRLCRSILSRMSENVRDIKTRDQLMLIQVQGINYGSGSRLKNRNNLPLQLCKQKNRIHRSTLKEYLLWLLMS